MNITKIYNTAVGLIKNCIIVIICFLFFISCKPTTKTPEPLEESGIVNQKIRYATGFTIQDHDTYKEIKIASPWPEAKNEHRYILYPKGTSKPNIEGNIKFVAIPVEKTIVTSTTDIPILEYLGLENKLVGFPYTDYISSEKTRFLVDNGTIKELGSERTLNTELVIELDPELIIGFSTDGNTKVYDLIEKSGIPIVINSSWMERHPLGRAEWIKFVAAFYNKGKEADTIFGRIEKKYNEAVLLAKDATTSPTILSGNMYKDVWYIPGGDSYIAQFLKDANTSYLWADTKKTGSLTLSFESVLEKAQDAEFWIGSGNSDSLSDLSKENKHYSLFNAFKNKTVYSSTLKKGIKGGLLYYELGPMCPDLILKDIIQIAHPELLQDHKPYFFKKLN